MSTPNLPPLVGDSSLATPPAPGEWVRENVSLDKLADSLDLPRAGGSAADLRSIPDVWAQVLAFHQALVFNRADQPHPLYAEARAQWRALLALFALRAAYRNAYLLRIEPLDLAEPPPGAGGTARGGPGALFRRVLGFLPPRDRLPQAGVGDAGEAVWERPALLYVRERTGGADDAPVFAAPWRAAGLLNPSTLIAPGRTASSLRVAAAPWLRDGLADPTALPPDRRLGRRDYALLVDWLQRLQRALAEIAGARANEATYNALSAELAAYAADCARLAEGFDRPIRLDDAPLVRSDLARLYRELQRAPVVDPAAYPQGHSDCALELRPEFGREFAAPPGADGGRPVFAGLILFDRELARTLNRAPQDVHVWREHTLQSLLDAPGLLAQVRREAADAGWLLVEPADYFTPEFARLAPGVVVDGHDEPFRGAVLPLSPLALWSLRPREVAPAMRLTSTGEGDYTVSLALPLAAGRLTHPIQRTWRTDAEGEAPFAAERVNAQFGAVSTWPDFAQRGWRWNFLRLSYNPGMTGLQGRFGVSAERMAEALAAEPDAGRRDLKARSWFDSSGLRLEEAEHRRPVTPPTSAASAGAPNAFERLRFRDSDVLVEELQISAAAPEAVCMARKRSASDRAARPVGLILLRQEPSRALQPESAVVAVDFGTTNTVASLRGEPVRFKNRVRMAIRQPANEEENRRDFKWSFVDFFPLADHASPIPTVAKRREIDAGADPQLRAVAEARDERPLFSDMIFFQPPLGDPLNHQTRQDVGELKRRQGSLRFKLKWSGDPTTKDISRRFLREFMLLTAAELVDRDLDPVRARWRFSFPEAMGAENERGLRRDLIRAWNDLFPDRAAPESDDHRVRPLTPESAAAAKYFLNYVEGGAASGVVNVVLDIGGGTTDIAIVRKSEAPLWRGSFRLAGGDFLTHYLMNNAEYFRHLRLDDLAELRGSFSSGWSTLYGAEDDDLQDFGELLFSDSRFARAMAERYDVVKDTAEGRGLRHSAFVFMGGLAWYVGLVARRLIQEGRIRPEELGAVSFGMGGRGATLFRHHQAAASGRPSPLNDLLGLFLAAAGVDPAAHPHRAVLFSRQAKMEVVLGMAGEGAADLDELQLLSEPPASRWTPLGEAVAVETADGPAELPADADAAALAGVTRAGVPGELAEFKRFLRALRELTGVQVDLREGARDGADDFLRTKLHAHLASVAAQVRALRPGDRPPVFEPPFIVLLRALLDRLGLPAAERRTRVSAEDV